MQLLKMEQVLWESKDKTILLTTHRLREMHKSRLGSRIKSVMLEELSSCELHTNRKFNLLRSALISFFAINGMVYLLNHYLFKAELIKFFFDELHITSETAMMIFYLSILVVVGYVLTFFLSVTKVFSFYAHPTVINVQLRWLSFDERESFISRVEDAKDQRQKVVYGH